MPRFKVFIGYYRTRRMCESMGKVIYEVDIFKRMSRVDLLALQRLVDAKKTGVFEVAYKEGKVRIEIRKKGDDTILSRFLVR